MYVAVQILLQNVASLFWQRFCKFSHKCQFFKESYQIIITYNLLLKITANAMTNQSVCATADCACETTAMLT